MQRLCSHAQARKPHHGKQWHCRCQHPPHNWPTPHPPHYHPYCHPLYGICPQLPSLATNVPAATVSYSIYVCVIFLLKIEVIGSNHYPFFLLQSFNTASGIAKERGQQWNSGRWEAELQCRENKVRIPFFTCLFFVMHVAVSSHRYHFPSFNPSAQRQVLTNRGGQWCNHRRRVAGVGIRWIFYFLYDLCYAFVPCHLITSLSPSFNHSTQCW